MDASTQFKIGKEKAGGQLQLIYAATT